MAHVGSTADKVRVQRSLRKVTHSAQPRERPKPHKTTAALISLEPWDEVWRRNQHFAAELLRQRLVEHVLFVEPPGALDSVATRQPEPGITVVTPRLRLPKRAGGLGVLGRELRRGPVGECDVLWVNDPALGVHCLSESQAALYDVTDDWREFGFPQRIKRRITRAENALAIRARTVVCSDVLRDRWRSRYGTDAVVIHNGVVETAWLAPDPHRYGDGGPHVGYVGTLHQDRLDLALLLSVADLPDVGRLHLVGPDSLDGSSRARLTRHKKVALHGPVPTREVPSWTTGLDVLLSPHLVSAFTLSLDAIKSYEYACSGRPIVATPTSGFQLMTDLPGVTTAVGTAFLTAVAHAACHPAKYVRDTSGMSWAGRAKHFAAELELALKGTSA